MAETAAPPLPFPVLAGDIGGTNARFAIVVDAHAEPKPFDPVATEDFPDIQTAIEQAVLARTGIVPKSAAIAVAGPVDGDEVDLTNARWLIKPREVIAEIGLSEMVLLNDFEALALSLNSLTEADLEPIGPAGYPASGAEHGPKVVLGPGTGLGVAGLVRVAGLWAPVPGEGGHVAIGPAEPDEFEIWPHIEPEFGRISAEALLAGRGLVRLYRAVAAARGATAGLATPSAVTDAALAGADRIAAETVSLYCRLLGRVAGDMALVFMATGGVYIGGGISPRILGALREGPFRAAFEAKAPHQALLASMPTAVITAPRPALTGIAAFARTPALYGVSLEGRRWTADD